MKTVSQKSKKKCKHCGKFNEYETIHLHIYNDDIAKWADMGAKFLKRVLR